MGSKRQNEPRNARNPRELSSPWSSRAAGRPAEVLEMVLVFGDRAIGHPDPVFLAFLDHHGDALGEKYARVELIVDRPAAGEKVPCYLIGLFGSRTAVVAENDVRHDTKTRRDGLRRQADRAADAAGLAVVV